MRLIGTTIAGGAHFLIPIVLLVYAGSKALKILERLVRPVARHLPESVAGVGVATLISIAILVLVCLLAGLVARYGGRFTAWFGDTVLGQIPQYKTLTASTRGVLTPEEAESLRVAAVRMEDSWQLAFVIEELEDGLLAVLLPEAPNPFSGSITFMDRDRVRMLDVPMAQAIRCIRRGGVGSRGMMGRRLSAPVISGP